MTSSSSILLAVLTPVGCAASPNASDARSSVFDAPQAPAVPGHASQAPATLEELYRSGVTFDEFLAQADRRKAMWTDHYGNGAVSRALIERANRVSGTWRILAVAEDWCSDSVNTIPYLALLTEQVGAIEMRIIDSDVGREIMEAHRTPDGRASTPTLLILDESYAKVGCWIERPTKLQAWALESRPKLENDEFLSQKMAWYREDGGEATVSEVLDLIEAAASGTPSCGG
jgi:hypothetical protein